MSLIVCPKWTNLMQLRSGGGRPHSICHLNNRSSFSDSAVISNASSSLPWAPCPSSLSTRSRCLAPVTVIMAIDIVALGSLVDRLVVDMFDGGNGRCRAGSLRERINHVSWMVQVKVLQIQGITAWLINTSIGNLSASPNSWRVAEY
jgi:hypothetical protein